MELARFALGYVEEPHLGHDMYRGWLAIPYRRPSPVGNGHSGVVSIRFRCIEDHDHKQFKHGKYMTLPDDRPRMYNTKALLEPSPHVAITEGELDAVAAEACGIPTVGIPGAQSWKPHFREPFLGYRDVLILADGDSPGMEFATTVAKTLPNSKIVQFPPGQDANSFVQAEGPEALRERVGL